MPLIVTHLINNEIRKIEKINKRIVQTKNDIYLNEICLKEGVHPNFFNIYILCILAASFLSRKSYKISDAFL